MLCFTSKLLLQFFILYFTSLHSPSPKVLLCCLILVMLCVPKKDEPKMPGIGQKYIFPAGSRAKVVPAIQKTILDAGRCWRQMIILMTMAKASIHTDAFSDNGKGTSSYNCRRRRWYFTKKVIWIDKIQSLRISWGMMGSSTDTPHILLRIFRVLMMEELRTF